MTKYHSSDIGALLKEHKYDLEDVEADISGLSKELFSFPGAQHFNEIMHEKMRPKKVAKFRAPRKMESDF